MDLKGLHAAYRATQGDMKPLLERLRASSLTRDEKDFIEARLTGRGGKMKRGPKVKRETAVRYREIIRANAWLSYCEHVTVEDNRVQILEGRTGLSATAVRKALAIQPDLITKIEIDLMRQIGLLGVSNEFAKPDLLET